MRIHGLSSVPGLRATFRFDGTGNKMVCTYGLGHEKTQYSEVPAGRGGSLGTGRHGRSAILESTFAFGNGEFHRTLPGADGIRSAYEPVDSVRRVQWQFHTYRRVAPFYERIACVDSTVPGGQYASVRGERRLRCDQFPDDPVWRI